MGHWDDPELKKIREGKDLPPPDPEEVRKRNDAAEQRRKAAAARVGATNTQEERHRSAPAKTQRGGVVGFGPAESVIQLAQQIQAWAQDAGLSMAEIRISYDCAVTPGWTTLAPTIVEGGLSGREILAGREYTALVTWSRQG